MKLAVQILLLFFVSFLIMPTVIKLIKKEANTAAFYSFSEEEDSLKEVKINFNFEILTVPICFIEFDSKIIHSENLSKHDKISSKIIIPPPDLV